MVSDDVSVAELQEQARAMIRAAKQEGVSLTGAEVGERFGRSRSWGRDRIADVTREEAIVADPDRFPAHDHPRDKREDDESSTVTAAAAGDEVMPPLDPAPIETPSVELGDPMPGTHHSIATNNTERPEDQPSAPGSVEPRVELVGQAEIRRAAVLQYTFYVTAALFALVGQVWVGVEKLPFPNSWELWAIVLVTTPAFAVIELAGVATSHQADLRRRLGEQAYGYRALSLLAAVVAAGFNLVGHWGEWVPAIGFTGLSVFAYCSWLMQSGARRRDTLRAAGQMARTAPVYGVLQWIREPQLTRRARTLAVEYGYGVHESLRRAREEARTEARRKAIAAAIERRIRSDKDEIGATIAATTYDLDRLADEVKDRLNYRTAADFIAADLVLQLGSEPITETTPVLVESERSS